MSPRAVGAWVLGALVAALATGDPIYRALVVLIAVNVLLRHRLPGRRLGPVLVAVAIASAVAVALNVALAHTGRTVLATIPDAVPGLGGPITLESAVYGAVAGLGIAAAVLAAAALSLLVEPDAAAAALPAALERTGTAIAASLALIPALGRGFRSVREAQLMRGWRARGPRSWSDLLVPVVLTAVEDSLQVAEAMEARGFGAGRRTAYRPAGWTAGDTAVTATALAAAAILVAARAAGLAADWYPYPVLVPPPASPVLVAATLLLAAPLLPWPWRVSTA